MTQNTNSISIELRALNVKKHVSLFKALEYIGISLLHGHETQQILCPFHDDSKPSARAYGDSGKLFCFTCHKTWDCISIVMQKRNVSFSDAIIELEEHFKIQSPLENLPLSVKFNVERLQSTEPKLWHLIQYVESRLIYARQELGLATYCKLFTALDLMIFQSSRKQLSDADFTVNLRKILSKIPSDV